MTKKIKINAALLVLCCIMLALGCKKENEKDIPKQEEIQSKGSYVLYKLKDGGQVSVYINEKGEYIVGGDVILSKDQISYLEANKIGSKNNGNQTQSTFTADFLRLWPNGIVYYVVNDPSNASNIAAAMAHWEANTSIRFVQRTNQANYVIFVGDPNSGGGRSELGMIGGPQYVVHGPNMGIGVIIHEIGHVVGLMHEQCRADRDQYINVNYNNIHNDYKYQYDTYIVKGISGWQLGSFDFHSVMLYMPYSPAAAINGSTVPQMTKKDGSLWAYNSILSDGDIQGVKYLYEPVYISFTSVYDPNNSYYESDGANERYRYTYNFTMRFYSDVACTIPLTLVQALKVKLRFYTDSQESYQYPVYSTYSEFEINADVGMDSVYLGPVVKYWDTEWGNIYGYHAEYYRLSQSVGYKYDISLGY
ncbi:M12 family metallopeptidase [Pedobacter sp.]|uniref:M12 family metallopeptidase n=1 Tax=Pedobacter sp. TaxID=1411316 RepID=UPI0031DED207